MSPPLTPLLTLLQVDAAAASAAAATGLSQSATSRDPKKLVLELILCTLDTTKVRVGNFFKRTRAKIKSRLRGIWARLWTGPRRAQDDGSGDGLVQARRLRATTVE